MPNTSAIRKHATLLPPTNWSSPSRKKKTIRNKGNTKKLISRKQSKHKFWKVGRTREKTEWATGLGRITRDQIESWNQLTALRFQTWGKHQKSPASLSAQKREEEYDDEEEEQQQEEVEEEEEGARLCQACTLLRVCRSPKWRTIPPSTVCK